MPDLDFAVLLICSLFGFEFVELRILVVQIWVINAGYRNPVVNSTLINYGR